MTMKPATAAELVRTALEQLLSATASEVADEADVSVTTARRHLDALVARGLANVTPGTGFSDMGRATNVHNYGWLGGTVAICGTVDPPKEEI